MMKFENTKEVISNRNSKTDRQYNGQKVQDQRTSKDPQDS
jgi:hypothetical protein